MISDFLSEHLELLDIGDRPDEVQVDKWLESGAGIEIANWVDFVRKGGSKKGHTLALRSFIAIIQETLQDKSMRPPTHLRSFLLNDDDSCKEIRPDIHQVYLETAPSIPLLLVLSCSTLPPNDIALLKYTKTLDPHEEARMLNESFNVRYQGFALTRFLHHVAICAKIYKVNVHYGKVIAVLQASASGKSRLVKELSNVEYLISICFRRSQEPSAGWPPGDMAALRYFRPEETTHYGEELAAAFLGALASVIADRAAMSDSAPFNMWSYDLKPNSAELASPARIRLMEEVVSRANQMLENDSLWLEEKRKCIFTTARSDKTLDASKDSTKLGSIPPTSDAATDPSGTDADISPSNSATSDVPKASQGDSSVASAAKDDTTEKQSNPKMNSSDWHTELFQHFCQSKFEHLSKLIESLNEARGEERRINVPRFFIAFDECAELGKPTTLMPSKIMSLMGLMRILKAADVLRTKVKFWFLLLDTNSEAFLLAPSGPNSAASTRLRGAYEVLPPFVHLGFNQMVTDDPVNLANEVLRLDFLQQWGRPYWSTVTSGSVVAYAQKKLFHKANSAADFDQTSRYHVFAAFAHRVALEIGEGAAASRLAVHVVSRHMHLLRSIVGGKMETIAPSEPVLAIAAADALNSDPAKYEGAMKVLLDALIVKDLILDRGGQGELCNRLLFILARDRAVTRESDRNFLNAEKTRITPIKLSEFLETLLGTSYGCKSDDENVPGLREWAQSRWVNWTHYVNLTEVIDEIPIRKLELAFFTGAIFQCHYDQDVIDWYAAVYNGPLDQKYNRKCLEVIGGQTKARGSAAGKKVALGLTLPPIVFTNVNGRDVRKKSPTLVMLMDLATNEHFGSSSGPTVELTQRTALSPFSQQVSESKRKKIWKGYAGGAPGDDPEPSNFLLNIRGRNVAQYPVLADLGVETHFEGLLQTCLSHPWSAEFREAEQETMEEMFHHEFSTRGPTAMEEDESWKD